LETLILVISNLAAIFHLQKRILSIHNKRVFIMKKLKLLQLLLSFILLFLASCAIHEYAHFLALMALGGEGYIQYNYCVMTKSPSSKIAFHMVSFMGGIGSGLFFVLVRIIEEDPEDKVVETMVAVYQFVYGFGEGLWSIYKIPLEVGSTVAVIASVAYLVYVLFIFVFKKPKPQHQLDD